VVASVHTRDIDLEDNRAGSGTARQHVAAQRVHRRGSGLLGSFDNVMAGMTADEVDAIADPGAPDTHSAYATSADAPVIVAPVIDTPMIDTAMIDTAQRRVVDPRARAVADRLLRRIRPVALDTVVVPDRLEVVAWLFVIADRPGHPDDAGDERNDGCTIGDGHTIVICRDICRGETAVDGDPPQLLVPYGVVSRQHCTVSRIGDVVTIADTGSANGTVIVRDAHIIEVRGEPVPLLNGDVVATAGGHRPFVRFEIDAGPDSRPEGATS
jgi:hypothetical protein